ncbi:hypothetical protein SAMN02745671_01694 [Anaerovibrio lipolyticus DSM 3074]|uniref:Uncharacterized protein n=2 Tax=Anaerovibrio lipolyticus TaxID=82374 RepID=A0A0B2JY18_9FIRM|nr:hypothetical protein [Anaerovibrio lipolyticus]KHM51603.1 hypothetical protein NZ47_09465 [Anaerovibrio lipolyticus]SHI78972.1 hypothetical protein SAMN02745671_01694 [Anaerovibrio lipolyticus DSM 3074]
MPNTLGKTEICNIALRRIGVRPVNNVETDVSTPATELKAVWSLAVHSVLRGAEWNFARKIIPLAELNEEKVLGWDYLYRYPNDCAALWAIEDENSIRSGDLKHKWESVLSPETNQQAIATDCPQAYGRYTALVEDPTKWDSQFVDCLGWRLAMDVCQALASDTGLFNKCSQMYAACLSAAQTANKTEKYNDEEIYGFFVNARG